ncbi:MAG: ATP-binding protein [Victivallales bacterium]|nr:ATP-binding protein [Victivallales bacterium]
MKTISTSTFNFNNIISNDFLYVDKTDYVHKLVKPAFGEYFLSRPRRFGKSLLVSTLKAIFQGRRELFKGLAIDKMDNDWEAYPVIHLDFGACMATTTEELDVYLKRRLAECASEHDLVLTGPNPQEQFIELILRLSKGTSSVVILVDEYDKPILSNIVNPNVSEILTLLKGFYSVIKTYEGLIRFAFITGVSKFAHVSLFSDLNNLTDITLNPEYAGMLGFSEADIRENFADRIPLAAKSNNCAEEELMKTLLKWYDGYRFSDAETHVCNPVSVSKFFNEGYKFSNYWDSTGMPSFLLKLAREKAYDYEAAVSEWYDESIFSAYELDRLDVTGLLWQTGYLTIKEVRRDEDGTEYRLDFPDREVQTTFSRRLIEFFASDEKGDAAWNLTRRFRTSIRNDDLDGFMTLFQSFLANISYDMHLPYEKYYQTIFFVVFKLLGASIDAESKTNEGRIDAYIRTTKKVYLFEFKLDKSAEKAIGQIIDHRYYEKFQGVGLPIVMVGVNFDSSKGRIDGWTIDKA